MPGHNHQQQQQQLQMALNNLRASSDEMRKVVQELKYEVEAQKQALAKTERSKVKPSNCIVYLLSFDLFGNTEPAVKI